MEKNHLDVVPEYYREVIIPIFFSLFFVGMREYTAKKGMERKIGINNQDTAHQLAGYLVNRAESR